MSNKVVFWQHAGFPHYWVLFSLDGQVWNGAAFEDVAAASWASYVLPLTPKAPCLMYEGVVPALVDFPATLIGVCYAPAGAAPGPADLPIDERRFDWTGTSIVTGLSTWIDMQQPVPTANPSQTVGDALNAARAIGFGRTEVVGNLWLMYAGDGTTVVRTFTLNDPNEPTRRQ